VIDLDLRQIQALFSVIPDFVVTSSAFLPEEHAL
jgi:hypothetical protein